MLEKLTIQECLDLYQKQNLAARIEDGQVKELKKEEQDAEANGG